MWQLNHGRFAAASSRSFNSSCPPRCKLEIPDKAEGDNMQSQAGQTEVYMGGLRRKGLLAAKMQ